jgi:hypothetical protein
MPPATPVTDFSGPQSRTTSRNRSQTTRVSSSTSITPTARNVIVRSPEALVCGSPVGNRLKSLALVDRELLVHVAGANDPHLARLDHGHRPLVRVDHQGATARQRQLVLPLRLVLQPQRCGCRFLAAQDGGDELVAQRAGEAEVADRQSVDHDSEVAQEARWLERLVL